MKYVHFFFQWFDLIKLTVHQINFQILQSIDRCNNAPLIRNYLTNSIIILTRKTKNPKLSMIYIDILNIIFQNEPIAVHVYLIQPNFDQTNEIAEK